ncbi:hypothetical protein PQR34_36405 [Paraburkholderia sediminicola]|jgi:hypothetical protein|uniref:hypothetical protein n=1 Tax=Paraburkholderia sediminicola TaxID=458836 RepID=UPI0038BB1A61
MEELLSSIPSVAIRDYMREAMSCYMAGAYRGSIVLSYIALFDDVLAKLGELANVNSDAKTIFLEASKRKNDQDVYESYLIDQLASKSLLSGLDVAFLTTLRTLRNKSAHPSGHKPSPEEARFIFFETVSRFLSRQILSTTQLVDELIGRLSNANFFPAAVSSDMKVVVGEETTHLHPAAMPQLVSKLVTAVTSADPNVAKNSGFFLIGLALQNSNDANSALRTKLLDAKASDAQYASIILQVLSANGELFGGISPTCGNRIRALLSAQIDQMTAAISESKLIHPLSTLNSIAQHMADTDFIAAFSSQLQMVFDKRPYSASLVKLVSTRPSVFAMYFPQILSNAGSSDFATANGFADAVDRLDSPLSALVTPEQAFQLIVAVLKAADWNAFSAKALMQSHFAGIPHLRAKAIEYVTTQQAAAGTYLSATSVTSTAITEFVATYLTDETVS